MKDVPKHNFLYLLSCEKLLERVQKEYINFYTDRQLGKIKLLIN